MRVRGTLALGTCEDRNCGHDGSVSGDGETGDQSSEHATELMPLHAAFLFGEEFGLDSQA
jgi:hypothetical protein